MRALMLENEARLIYDPVLRLRAVRLCGSEIGSVPDHSTQ